MGWRTASGKRGPDKPYRGQWASGTAYRIGDRIRWGSAVYELRDGGEWFEVLRVDDAEPSPPPSPPPARVRTLGEHLHRRRDF